MNKYLSLSLFRRLTSINDLLHVVAIARHLPLHAEKPFYTAIYARRACILHIFRFVAIHLVRAAFFPVTGVDIYVFTWALRFDVLLYVSASNEHCGTLINYIVAN